jgi:hypothetical protein
VPRTLGGDRLGASGHKIAIESDWIECGLSIGWRAGLSGRSVGLSLQSEVTVGLTTRGRVSYLSTNTAPEDLELMTSSSSRE